MGCGLTGCPDSLPLPWDNDFESLDKRSNSISYLQVIPNEDEFEREELQDIRDRARRLSIQGSPAKTVEERLYQELADVTDQLDAFAAREEAEVAEAFGNVTIVTAPVIKGHRHNRPFLGGYRKPR
ncbi:hypothetical protein LCGC14_1973140 [marine sediment metagenome]|uniref:Uncharacterized protein n=1 Tax=marine sediment metagenome TaxID=412755 RepID=A0A0F9FZB0_9ZZZZ